MSMSIPRWLHLHFDRGEHTADRGELGLDRGEQAADRGVFVLDRGEFPGERGGLDHGLRMRGNSRLPAAVHSSPPVVRTGIYEHAGIHTSTHVSDAYRQSRLSP